MCNGRAATPLAFLTLLPMMAQHNPGARMVAIMDSDVVAPMHCSGDKFVRQVREQMPDKLLLPTTGSRLTFGA